MKTARSAAPRPAPAKARPSVDDSANTAAQSATATLRPIKGTTAPPRRIYVGTYTGSGSDDSQGIYTLLLDRPTGALSAPQLAARADNPTWLTPSADKRWLYAVNGGDAQALAFAIDPETGRLAPDTAPNLGNGGKPPCHLAISAHTLIASHYHSGKVAALQIRADGSLGPVQGVADHNALGHPTGPHPTRQDRAHVHSATLSPDNRYAYLCDLGLDRIYAYAVNPARPLLSPAPLGYTATRPGAGPRHATFSRDGRHLLVVGELDSTLSTYAYDPATAALTHVDTQPLLPADFSGENTAAEVALHPNGRWAYASNRGHDSIAAFAFDAASGRLKPLGHTPSGGRAPRHFAICPCGRWLVTANQDSGTVCTFAIDQKTGRPAAKPASTAAIPKPVCIAFGE